jgi:exodeoxyribonuclease-3
MFTVATWNVNSIRAREERLLAWLEKSAPDVVCLQELKVVDDDFPFETLRDVGYHAVALGQPTYNGVAILSREVPTHVVKGFEDGVDDPQARAITATVNGYTIASLYIPNGRTVGSEKWEYKLSWFERLERFVSDRLDLDDKVLLCGDFNVAPEDRDVAKPERWKDSVLCHPDGRAALARIVDLGLTDTTRMHHEGPGPYSWWDYRMLAFPKGDGVRIDHILASKSAAAKCVGASIDRDERKGKKPSDHAPVLAVFD